MKKNPLIIEAFVNNSYGETKPFAKIRLKFGHDVFSLEPDFYVVNITPDFSKKVRITIEEIEDK